MTWTASMKIGEYLNWNLNRPRQQGANERTLEEYPYRLQIFVISRPGPNLHFKPSNPSENLAFSPSTRPHRLRWPLTPWLMGVGRSPENKDPSPASPVKAEQPLPTSPEKSDRATDSPGNRRERLSWRRRRCIVRKWRGKSSRIR